MPTLREIIRNVESVELTGRDIKKIAGDYVNLVVYDELKDYQTIEDLFNGNPCAILLYRLAAGYNHWVAINKRGDEIDYYNSYGLQPDAELDMSTYKFEPRLGYLLANSPYKVNINNERMQRVKSSVNTCGRWAALRCLFKHLTNHEFNEQFKRLELKTPDEIVTALTFTIDLD